MIPNNEWIYGYGIFFYASYTYQQQQQQHWNNAIQNNEIMDFCPLFVMCNAYLFKQSTKKKYF